MSAYLVPSVTDITFTVLVVRYKAGYTILHCYEEKQTRRNNDTTYTFSVGTNN